jgi:oligopeptide/dipeptide ABC transporter ATP-binding protein
MSALERDSINMIKIDKVYKAFGITRRRGLGVERKLLRAVDGISFSIAPGESFGIVGESGSGKSTLARLIMGLEKPTSGSIAYVDRDVSALSAKEVRAYWRDVQIVFQDPFSSLNPRMRIGDVLAEPLRNFLQMPADRRKERIEELLDLVGLPRTTVQRYPHELSGGQRQRVAIAAALAGNPKVIVADEAVSALDVSIQAQIVNLLIDLRKRLGLTYVFITHDLNLCTYFCDRIAVLYLGQIMEICAADRLLAEPLHPYTQALISAIPAVDVTRRRERIILSGEIPSPIDPPSGCPFQPRCPMAVQRCREERPKLVDVGDAHSIACHVVADRLTAQLKPSLAATS